MVTLLSVDPGGKGAGHTGIVLLQYTDTAPPIILDTWAVPDGLEGWLGWYDHHVNHNSLDEVEPDEVVCEHFVNRNVPGADLTPCFIEGSVRTLYRHTVLQPASGKNSAVPDAVMAALGFSKKEFKGDHHGDRWEALRHAIWYLKKNRHLPTLRAGWPSP